MQHKIGVQEKPDCQMGSVWETLVLAIKAPAGDFVRR